MVVAPTAGSPDVSREGASVVYNDLRRLQARFLASVNHEFRTPLAGILGMAELLFETELTEEQKEYLDAIRQCAENLVGLLNRVLDYADLSAGTAVLDDTEFDLRGELEAALGPYRERAEAKGLEFSAKLDGDLPAIAVGDPARIRQILGHLLDNAIKFTHRGQVKVTARTCRREGQRFGLEITVQDTGVGIPEEKLGSICEVFGSLECGFSRGYAGMGLGLAIVSKTVQLMGGQLRVSSRLGQGSTFAVELPLQAAVPITGPERNLAQTDQPVRRILVVEDDIVAQRIVTRMLEQHSYVVTCAASGLEALQLAATARFDLVLLDLQMPEMDGVETAVRLRRLSGYDKVPMVAVTANATEEYRRRCAAAGMQAFLTKPVSGADLVATVAAFLS